LQNTSIDNASIRLFYVNVYRQPILLYYSFNFPSLIELEILNFSIYLFCNRTRRTPIKPPKGEWHLTPSQQSSIGKLSLHLFSAMFNPLHNVWKTSFSQTENVDNFFVINAVVSRQYELLWLTICTVMWKEMRERK